MTSKAKKKKKVGGGIFEHPSYHSGLVCLHEPEKVALSVHLPCLGLLRTVAILSIYQFSIETVVTFLLNHAI